MENVLWKKISVCDRRMLARKNGMEEASVSYKNDANFDPEGRKGDDEKRGEKKGRMFTCHTYACSHHHHSDLHLHRSRSMHVFFSVVAAALMENKW